MTRTKNIVVVNHKLNNRLALVLEVKKEEFTKDGLIKSVKAFYRNIYDLDEDPNVSLIPLGNTTFTDILVTFKDGSKEVRKDLTWTFSRTVKYIYD